MDPLSGINRTNHLFSFSLWHKDHADCSACKWNSGFVCLALAPEKNNRMENLIRKAIISLGAEDYSVTLIPLLLYSFQVYWNKTCHKNECWMRMQLHQTRSMLKQSQISLTKRVDSCFVNIFEMGFTNSFEISISKIDNRRLLSNSACVSFMSHEWS